MMPKFLKPNWVNVIVTLIVFSLPFIGERASLPDGTITETIFYRPIFLLVTYLQMQDWQPFLLMVGLLVVIYIVVSIVVALVSKLFIRAKKK